MVGKDYAKLAYLAGAACLVLAAAIAIVLLLGGPRLILSGVATIIPGLIIPLFILSGILFLAGMVLLMHEVVTSKNDDGWKMLFIAIIFFLGIIGAAIYFVFGRKERKP